MSHPSLWDGKAQLDQDERHLELTFAVLETQGIWRSELADLGWQLFECEE